MSISKQAQALQAAIGELKTAVSAAMERIELKLSALEAKLAEAGEPDPDLQASIDEVRGETSRLTAVLAETDETGKPVEKTGEASPGGFVEPVSE